MQMTDKPTDREVLRRALNDAIEWEISYAGCCQAGSPERAEALAQVNRYRALLKRRYGTRDTPMEAVGKAMAKAGTFVTVHELGAAARKKDRQS